ncbi:MAG: 1-deoxy-D-xylulose 5-phosphate reductoisomerase [Melioribacteraceae bacterium]|nr:MAG: 1-deoxy-D-xylulose 5-phosphate reductoisomerase [Melioribacteraceae bacterium]
MKKICLLGASGSIGESTLEVVRKYPEKFSITALTVNTSINKLQTYITEFAPEVVVISDEKSAEKFLKSYKGKTEILAGRDALNKVTGEYDYDILLSALVGFAGLEPTLEAIKRKKRIGLANKETLVAAGEIVMKAAKESGSEIIPVDSEHSAIFQCLVGEDKAGVEKLILTASGGPFREYSSDELKNVSLGEALNHPNWKMGSKITIDSATMMNKGLEVIEAYWLFGLPLSKIEVVVHPQSIVHSMVEFVDGSIKAQLSLPDMKIPIQYALSFPERLPADYVTTRFPKLRELTFFEPDLKKFRSLKLAFNVLEQGGCAPCILNAANEVAVNKFLTDKVDFLHIPDIVEDALSHFENHTYPDFETITEYDRLTREYVDNKY